MTQFDFEHEARKLCARDWIQEASVASIVAFGRRAYAAGAESMRERARQKMESEGQPGYAIEIAALPLEPKP
jgi:hypothetical protein